MKILKTPSEFTGEKSILALGMFDGVHVAHQKLIRTAVSLGRERGVPAVVCTFDRHPLTVLAPGRAPEMLTTQDERLKKFALLGVDCALITPFTRAFSEIPAGEYLDMLAREMHPLAVVVGANHRFGRFGDGDAALIAKKGRALGFDAIVLSPVLDGADVVSSTLIRRLLREKDFARADRLMRI